ncbi:MAG: hypothetical protein DMF84_07030 [Acidobacteria bacterium]|nr:MAG: hypothetical protein DMF84_07030 [Acidobacteriota bacterium]
MALVMTNGAKATTYAMTVELQNAPACLHDEKTESAEQAARKRSALGATRAINTAESRYAAANKRYGAQGDLAGLLDPRYNLGADPGTEIVPGFTLTLDVSEKGYWFEVKDTTDPCGFRFISNQQGLIFTARPIQ